jgi:phosphoglycerate dehydrogenase-like enzyme
MPKETDMSLNAAVFAQMKLARFVHCGSGSVIDESALADAIRSGQIGGAALDTFEWEPIKPDNPLLALARTADFNVLLTRTRRLAVAISMPAIARMIMRMLRGFGRQATAGSCLLAQHRGEKFVPL